MVELIALDGLGQAHVTGSTGSSNFPTVSPIQAMYGGANDAFVAKVNVTGSALVFSTYLGGSSGDLGDGIAVSALGDTDVAGNTTSANFPTTPGAFDTTLANGITDGFVARIGSAAWNGDRRPLQPAASTFFLRNGNSAGAADVLFGYGPPGAGWTPLVGDWDGL